MSGNISFDLSAGALVAIILATIVSYAWRAGGYWAMGFVKPSPRVERALAALPGSIIAAIVLPAIAHSGTVAFIAVATAIGLKAWRGSDIIALLGGLAVAVALRAGLG